MLDGFTYYLFFVVVVAVIWWRFRLRARRRLAMADDDPESVLFKMGYFLYTRTSLGKFYHGRNIKKASEKFAEGHSVVTTEKLGNLQIKSIPLVEDNFCYIISDVTENTTVLVDPSDAATVQQCLKGITPNAILTTHKHWDHAGGNDQFLQQYPSIRIYGGVEDTPAGCTDMIDDGAEISVGPLQFTAYHTPGHTVGHMVYLLDTTKYGAAPKSLFSGDFIFLGGMGQIFEGDAATMLRSLDRILELCSDDTLIWPGHEYTKVNLMFAVQVEPKNDLISSRLEDVRRERRNRKPTCPGTVGEEKSTNVFLRTHCQEVRAYAGLEDESVTDDLRVRVLFHLRKERNRFSRDLKKQSKKDRRHKTASAVASGGHID